jgi:hypothetical protein
MHFRREEFRSGKMMLRLLWKWLEEDVLRCEEMKW